MRAILFISLWFSVSIIEAADIRVASAANFYPTLNKIKRLFEESTEHQITIIRGSTGKLYAQIIHGAPYDVFLSADSDRAEKLVAQGKAYDGKALVYAIGQLALWKPHAESAQQVREQLINNKFNRLAVANPKTAPYGKAAIETLKAMGLYKNIKSKLVYGENISQTLQFVQSGAAELGFVARSHMINKVDKAEYWSITTNQHQAIQQKMLLLKSASNIKAAQAFVSFMQTPNIKKLIQNDGYQL